MHVVNIKYQISPFLEVVIFFFLFSGFWPFAEFGILALGILVFGVLTLRVLAFGGWNLGFLTVMGTRVADQNLEVDFLKSHFSKAYFPQSNFSNSMS